VLNRNKKSGFPASDKSPSFGRFAAQDPADPVPPRGSRSRRQLKVACPDAESCRRSRRSRDSGNSILAMFWSAHIVVKAVMLAFPCFAVVLDDHFRQDATVS